MKPQIQVSDYQYRKLHRTKTMALPLGLSLIAILVLSASVFKQQDGALAQQYIQTIKYRNLAIDLGNGLKTNAQLTLLLLEKDHFLVYFLFLALVLLIRTNP